MGDTYGTDKSPELQTASNRLLAGHAWEEFCDQLKASGRMALLEDAPLSHIDHAEGFRHLTRILATGLKWIIEDADPDFPYFTRSPDPETKGGMDNPDFLYLQAPIRGDAEYLITGTRDSLHRLIFQVNEGLDVLGNSHRISYMTSENLTTDEQGRFEIVLSSEPHDTNWLPLEPDASHIMVRQVFYDWDNEFPADIQITITGGNRQYPEYLRPERMEYMLDSLVKFLNASVEHWTNRQLNLISARDENTINPPRKVPGQGAEVQYYGSGPLNLDWSEALIIEIEPTDAPYWGIQLGNFWWESLDYANHQTSLNGYQARQDSDGKFRFVIALEDPGVPNWLDLAGHQQGIVLMRFLGPSSDPPPPCVKTVKFEHLRSELPNDTTFIDRQTRAALIEKRRAHISRRYHI